MTTRVAFLRAVNLGKRRVDMKRLASVTIDSGFDEVWTYVNSGNVVFDGTGRREAIEDRLQTAYERRVRLRVHDLRADRVGTAGSRCRGAVRPGNRRHLLRHVPQVEPDRHPGERDLEAMSNSFDTLVVRGRDVHWLDARPFERLAAQEAGLGAHPRPEHLDEPEHHHAGPPRGQVRRLMARERVGST